MTTPRKHIHRAEPITLPAGSNLVPVIRFVAQCSSSSPLAAVLNKDAAMLLLTPLMVGVVRQRYPGRASCGRCAVADLQSYGPIRLEMRRIGFKIGRPAGGNSSSTRTRAPFGDRTRQQMGPDKARPRR